MKHRHTVVRGACIAGLLLGMAFSQIAEAAPRTQTATFALG